MLVNTNVLDVLPDGFITRLELSTEAMSVTIGRASPDENYMIEKVDVRNVAHMEEALCVLADHLHDYCIYSINIDRVDGTKAALKV